MSSRLVHYTPRRPILRRLYRAAGGSCAYCGRRCKIRPREALRWEDDHATIDHAVPQCRGGEDHWDNFILACFKCNGDKGELTAEEYRAWRGREASA